MLNKEKLATLLTEYKADFPTRWKREGFKLVAIKNFQAHWDINAKNFYEMLNTCLSKTDKLLRSGNYYPAGVINDFAKKYPEQVRKMFKNLFDESLDLTQRIETFKKTSDKLLEQFKQNDGALKQHYQDKHAITTYLWLHNPDKYYMYKFEEYKRAAEALCIQHNVKKNQKDNVTSSFAFYDEVNKIIKHDAELVELVKKHLDTNHYKDKNLKVITIDFCFFVSRRNERVKIPTQNNNSENQQNNVKPNMSTSAVTEKYTKQDFLNEVFMTEEKYDEMAELLETKKNIILQGAPGVGKTFAAERLAYSLIGHKDNSRVKFIQFHQNYSYEDFVIGYKPVDGGFELKRGVFYDFCIRAANNPTQAYFFIIDEINRGNMSKIFGELLMMIESDYRGKPVQLAYTNDTFIVPRNVYIIGMMNTADRSLAMIDYALRRRFSFVNMEPGFETTGFKKYLKKNPQFSELTRKIIELNAKIASDSSLGKGFCIGHSYLCNPKSSVKSIIKHDLIPLIQEYWFDNESEQQQQINTLQELIK